VLDEIQLRKDALDDSFDKIIEEDAKYFLQDSIESVEEDQSFGVDVKSFASGK